MEIQFRGRVLTEPDMENGRHKLEIHIKFADDWLTMAEMDNIHNEELLSAMKFLSQRLIKSMEQFYRGDGLGDMKAGKLDGNDMLKGEL